MKLAYGTGCIDSYDIGIDLSSYSQILEYGNIDCKEFNTDKTDVNKAVLVNDVICSTPAKYISTMLSDPAAGKPFNQLLDTIRPEVVSIIVEDRTRKNPEYPEILNGIISRLKERQVSEIFLIIAYGTHKWHTEAENAGLYGQENLDRVTLINHDCHSKADLVAVGTATENDQLYVSKYAIMSDLLLVIGSVKPHAFAGFTGGRKAILPGIAGYKNIRRNHSMVLMDNVSMGCLEGNPINIDMELNANLVKIDFSIQMVKDAEGKLAAIYSGEQKIAFEAAVKLSEELCGIRIREKADVVIAVVGGAPRDRSLYQAQRAITNASMAVKNTGTIFVIGSLADGIGNEIFETWLQKPHEEIFRLERESIDVGIHSAYLMAKNFSRCSNIYLYSSMDAKWAEKYHFHNLSKLEEIHTIAEQKYGTDYSAVLIPNASDIMVLG